MSLCLVRLIEPVFRSIEHRESSFFKQYFDWFKTLFQNVFKLSSFSPTWQGSTEDFFSFSTKFLQGFSLTRPVRPLYPSFCFYFHDFMHKLMNFKGFSELFKFGIFVESILFFGNWSLGFASILIYSRYILVSLINLGFLWTTENSRVCIESNLGILFNWVKIDEIGLLNWCNWSL